MKTVILLPSDYFSLEEVDTVYESERNTVLNFSELIPVNMNYDAFISGASLKLYPQPQESSLCIYRGWMFNPGQYKRLFDQLLEYGLTLINTPEQYSLLHLFPHIYDSIKLYTPKTIWFEENHSIDWKQVNEAFDKFMIKDYVKSVKGTDFPAFFETPVDEVTMNTQIARFVELRDNLYTGGIVIKEYVPLKKYGGSTNEFRVFFSFGNPLSISPNSSQPESIPHLPLSFAQEFTNLGSNFYTIDFAECESGEWLIIETGDGQVSGLSHGQDVSSFYEVLVKILFSL